MENEKNEVKIFFLHQRQQSHLYIVLSGTQRLCYIISFWLDKPVDIIKDLLSLWYGNSDTYIEKYGLRKKYFAATVEPFFADLASLGSKKSKPCFQL